MEFFGWTEIRMNTKKKKNVSIEEKTFASVNQIKGILIAFKTLYTQELDYLEMNSNKNLTTQRNVVTKCLKA